MSSPVSATTEEITRWVEPSRPLTLTYIIGTYPLLTTTFIDREIRMLRERGVVVNVVSIRRPRGVLSAAQRALAESTQYVLPASKVAVARNHLRFLVRRPLRYLSTLGGLVSGRHASWRARLKTVGHFGLGVHIAGIVAARYPADQIHAHFVDRATLVALVVGRLLDLPYSATAHANDIYVDPVLLEEKLANARFVATCTGYNEAHLARVAGSQRPTMLRIYHGLDLSAYEPDPEQAAGPPMMLAVGQLKEKKGFGDLLTASRELLDRGIDFRCEIIGEGPLRPVLEETIDRLELGGHVTLRGALPHDEVIAAYRRASLFVLPCVVAADGDRDGIPNVILEASAMELPVVSTRHSGIPEAVEHEASGLLVEPGAPDELTDALARLIEDPEERRRFGTQGRVLVGERFDVGVNVRTLYEQFATVRSPDVPATDSALFLVWGPPSHGPRSKVFSRELGIDVYFVHSTNRRRWLAAPYKYPVQAVKTARLLWSKRPKVVFVQSPPSPAVAVVALYAAMTKSRYVVDTHSAAMQAWYWTRPEWLHRLLARRAAATIVTNEHFAERVEGWGARALVIRDIPTTFPEDGEIDIDDGFAVAVVNTFAFDEPLDEIIAAASAMPEVAFHVTGRMERAPDGLVDRAPANVHFTGFLEDADYYALLRRADAVMCLTTRDHTMQRGACEALSLGRPIITSDWPLLRTYFNRGAVHVDATVPEIRDGVRRVRDDHDHYQYEIGQLQAAQRAEWATASTTLEEVTGISVNGGQKRDS